MSEDRLRAALAAALSSLGVEDVDPHLERPRDPDHGDFATNVAMTLAGRLKRPPRAIAEELASAVDRDAAGITSIEVAGPGFLNFRLSTDSVAEVLVDICAHGEDFGRSHEGKGRKVVVEWVSANPTGPLHLGHGRQAALGDAISSLLESTGWQVHREYYYNDSGKQMDRLASSVWARYQQLLGEEADVPEDGYQGEYVSDVAGVAQEEYGDRFRSDDSDEALEAMRKVGVATLRAEQDRDLADFGVVFDEYFLESSLYETGEVDRTVERLRETGLVYEKDG
ncbi:MAG TPA: arginine--tRNA ligase, partial [Longimicrobiales bacterium]|nr:arginine--tRNA ligase [Longimicrobiales bacterium]